MLVSLISEDKISNSLRLFCEEVIPGLQINGCLLQLGPDTVVLYSRSECRFPHG